MNKRELPGALRRELDKQPLRVVCEYLCARIGQDKGEKDVHMSFVDGRYERGLGHPTGVPFSKLQE